MKTLECEKLSKNYGSTCAVKDITCTLQAGKIYALVGPNGSGKSTWLKMLAGLVKATSGKILFDGVQISNATKKCVAFMPSESFFYNWMDVNDLAKYYKTFFADFDTDRFYTMCKEMKIEENKKASSLSTGTLAKLKIALTMARRASLYLLDEPLNGIDILAREEIISTIVSTLGDDCTLVVASHLIEELEKIADIALFIKDGVLIEEWNCEEKRENRNLSVIERYKEIFA